MAPAPRCAHTHTHKGQCETSGTKPRQARCQAGRARRMSRSLHRLPRCASLLAQTATDDMTTTAPPKRRPPTRACSKDSEGQAPNRTRHVRARLVPGNAAILAEAQPGARCRPPLGAWRNVLMIRPHSSCSWQPRAAVGGMSRPRAPELWAKPMGGRKTPPPFDDVVETPQTTQRVARPWSPKHWPKATQGD